MFREREASLSLIYYDNLRQSGRMLAVGRRGDDTSSHTLSAELSWHAGSRTTSRLERLKVGDS